MPAAAEPGDAEGRGCSARRTSPSSARRGRAPRRWRGDLGGAAASVDPLVARAVAAKRLVGGEHLAAPRALVPCPLRRRRRARLLLLLRGDGIGRVVASPSLPALRDVAAVLEQS